jgi:LETM1 and EF-hand domain-containing protein 1
MYLSKLSRQLIKEEGIDSLTGSELRSACQARGMIYQNYPHAKTQLEQWLNLSLEKDVPASLLILSRALALSPADSRPPTPWYEPKAKEVEPAGQLAEALQQTISGLPETLLENTQLNCPTTAPEDNQVKLQALKTEMGKIKQEEEQRKQEKEKEKQEKLEKEKKEKVASESAPIAMEKKHKAPTAEDLLQVTEAVTTLASSSASTVMKERSELAELKEMLEDQKQALKDLAAAERKEELARPSTEPKKAEKKDKVMTQLEAELETIVKRLDKELDEVDKETKSFFSLVDKNKDGYISFDEFNFAMEQLRKKYSPEEVRDMFAMLDLNSDGQISIHDLHQLVSEKEKVDDLRAKRLVDGVKKVTKDILNARTDTQTPTQQQAQQ